MFFYSDTTDIHHSTSSQSDWFDALPRSHSIHVAEFFQQLTADNCIYATDMEPTSNDPVGLLLRDAMLASAVYTVVVCMSYFITNLMALNGL